MAMDTRIRRVRLESGGELVFLVDGDVNAFKFTERDRAFFYGIVDALDGYEVAINRAQDVAALAAFEAMRTRGQAVAPLPAADATDPHACSTEQPPARERRS